jgi:hypothetical protein
LLFGGGESGAFFESGAALGSAALHASRAERHGRQRPVPSSGLSAYLGVRSRLHLLAANARRE